MSDSCSGVRKGWESSVGTGWGGESLSFSGSREAKTGPSGGSALGASMEPIWLGQEHGAGKLQRHWLKELDVF